MFIPLTPYKFRFSAAELHGSSIGIVVGNKRFSYADYNQLMLNHNLNFLLNLLFRTEHLVALSCFTPMHSGYTACTIREQFWYSYAETACKASTELFGDFGQLDVIDGFFPFSPSIVSILLKKAPYESHQAHKYMLLGF